MAKVLVIGGAGYIGSHVVKELLQNKHQVTVFDNLSTGQKCNLFENASFVEADILDFSTLTQVMSQGFDAVIHLAAKKAVGESMENPEKYALNNITGTLNILNAMCQTGIKRIVFSSSAAVYGMPQYLPVDENHPKNPINFYGYTKAVIEDILAWYSRLKNINYIALRYFNAVGYAADKTILGKEQNPQNLLPIVMEVATGKRAKILVYGQDYPTSDGTCERDYIHVSDLATAHAAAISHLLKEEKSYILNLGTGKPVSVKQVLEAAQKVTGKTLCYEYAPRRAGDPAVLVASSKEAEKVLGWKAQYTNIEDIIRTTYNIEF